MLPNVNYNVLLRLKEMALRRIAVILWNDKEMLAEVEEFVTMCTDFIDERRWSETFNSKIEYKISSLVPESLKKQIMVFVNPIGLQLRNWVKYHITFLNCPLGVPVLEKLCWTSAGSINYCKTAQVLIHCKRLDDVKSYELACLYCLKEFIPKLWETFPDEIKCRFLTKDTSYIELLHLQFCWPRLLKGDYDQLFDVCSNFHHGRPTTFQQHAFESSAEKGNEAAAKYFFNQLSCEEEDISCFNAAMLVLSRCQYGNQATDELPLEKLADVLAYLLSMMSRGQQRQFFINFSYPVLLCFMAWPWQDLFFRIAEHTWESLLTEEYLSLLWKMIESFQKSEYFFPKLFGDYFAASPVKFRLAFVQQECITGRFFSKIFDVENSETIKAIFHNVGNANRIKLLSSELVFSELFFSASLGKWGIVEVFLQEAINSKESCEIVKNAFIEFRRKSNMGKPENCIFYPNEAIDYYGQNQDCDMLWNNIFHLLNEISLGKRSPENETE